LSLAVPSQQLINMERSSNKKRKTSESSNDKERKRIFFGYAAFENIYFLRQCINDGIDVETKNDGGETALLVAVRRNNLDKVQYLIKECNANVEATNKIGYTALHVNCTITESWYRNKSLEMLQYLTKECKVNVEALTKKGRTALHLASNSNSLEKVLYLIKECNVNIEAKDNDGRTALHISARYNNLSNIQCLTRKCNVNVEAQCKEGWTALHYASKYGHLNIVKYLVDECHVNITTTTNNGETAFDIAKNTPKNEVIAKYLLQVTKYITNKTCEINKSNDVSTKEDNIVYKVRKHELVVCFIVQIVAV
jgi:ankyrin repeat protein